MAQKNTVQAAEYALLLGSALTTAFQPINTSGLPYPCFLLRIGNSTDLNVIISYDGSTSHDFIRTLETLQLTTQNNSLPSSEIALFPKGMVVYVKSTASGSGTIYVSAYYQTV